MNRREMMQGATAALLAALTPELLIGTATAGGPIEMPTCEEELPAFFAQLDRQVAALSATPTAPAR